MNREAAYAALRGYGLFGYQAAEVLHSLDDWGYDRSVPGVPVSIGKDGDEFVLILPVLVDNRAPLCNDGVSRPEQTEGGDSGSIVQGT